MADDLTIQLNKPVDLPEGDGATVLRFIRRANAGDLAAAGVRLDLSAFDDGEGSNALSLDAQQVNTIAARCSGLPLRIVESLDASDWVQVYAMVMSFFVS